MSYAAEPPGGFEPPYTAYKAVVLPLDDGGIYYSPKESNLVSSDISRFLKTVEDELQILLSMMESDHRCLLLREVSCH